MSDKLSKLLPCPFCGGRASSSQQTTGGRWAAYCLNCEAMVDGEFSEPDAIAAWNRRASPAPAIPMPPLNDAMRAVLTNENCVYGTPDELYAALGRAAPAISESEDAKLLDFLAAESADLVSFAIPYEDDADIGWRVLQHHIREAETRVIGEVFEDDPRAAIRAARKENQS
ncbi:Lar family restriction alleviation protein [Burkholderia gladioli]|uniref:Lar family restriction alleviation protein n=1 Tax=Burkholderia gladioli TaxID=28095 RepID=UPI0016402634|nr:Lar family restriction alleviation protein [Burkholderia gladioli]